MTLPERMQNLKMSLFITTVLRGFMRRSDRLVNLINVAHMYVSCDGVQKRVRSLRLKIITHCSHEETGGLNINVSILSCILSVIINKYNFNIK